MMRQEETDVFAKQIIFNYLVEQIRFERHGFSQLGRAYIEETLDYFDDVKELLEMFSRQKHLREIFEAINGEGRPMSEELVTKTVEKLGEAQEQLEQLAESPIDFYQTKGANKLLDICQKFSHVYDQMD